MRRSRVRATVRSWVLSLMAALMILSTPSWAQEDNKPIGTVLAVDGMAEVQPRNTTGWEVLGFRDRIFQADTVRTGADSKVKVLLRDESIMTLSEQSEMTFTEFLLTPKKKRSVIKLLFGKLKVLATRVVGSGSSVEVHTPNAVAGVRGTSFIVQFTPPDKTEIFVLEGTVTASNLDPAVPEIEAIPPNARSRVIGKLPPEGAVELTPGERQAIEQAVKLIEQVPEEVTPTDQQDPQREVRGVEGAVPPPDSAIVVVSELLPFTDIPLDIETLIEAGVTDLIVDLVTGGPQTEALDDPSDTPAGAEAVQESISVGVPIEIVIPR